MTTKIQLNECPACGEVTDRVTGVNCKKAPAPGDVTICACCGAINEFDKDMMTVLVPIARCQEADMSEARAVQRRVRTLRGWSTS